MNFTDGTSTSQHGGDGIDEAENKYTKVYIGGLFEDIGNDKLQDEFEKFGPVEKVWIARSPHSKGYAFVDYFDPVDAARAIKEMNGKQCFGGKILVQISRPGNKKKHRFINDTTSAIQYTDVKFDYESESTTDVTRDWRPRDRSPRRICRSYEHNNSYHSPHRYRDSLNHSSTRRENKSHDCSPSRKRNQSRDDRDSPRRYNQARERSRHRRRNHSRDRNSPARYNQLHSPSPRLSYENDARNSKNENATEDLTYQENVPFENDNETIERIREAVVRETVPQIYSMILKDILLHDPLKLQCILPVLPSNLNNTSNIPSSAQFPINSQIGTTFLPNFDTTNNQHTSLGLPERLAPQFDYTSAVTMQNGKTAPNHLPPSVCTTMFSNKTPKPKTQNSLWNNSPLIPAYASLPFPPNTQPMAQNYISPMAQTNNTQLQSRVTPAIWNNRQQRNGNNGQTGTIPIVTYPHFTNVKPPIIPSSNFNISSTPRLHNQYDHRQ